MSALIVVTGSTQYVACHSGFFTHPFEKGWNKRMMASHVRFVAEEWLCYNATPKTVPISLTCTVYRCRYPMITQNVPYATVFDTSASQTNLTLVKRNEENWRKNLRGALKVRVNCVCGRLIAGVQ